MVVLLTQKAPFHNFFRLLEDCLGQPAGDHQPSLPNHGLFDYAGYIINFFKLALGRILILQNC
jgi:hypothetical protein